MSPSPLYRGSPDNTIAMERGYSAPVQLPPGHEAQTQHVDPVYYTPQELMAGWDQKQIAYTQYLLSAYGNLEGTYHEGKLDQKTQDAVFEAMMEARDNNMTWGEWMSPSKRQAAQMSEGSSYGSGSGGPTTSTSTSTSTSVSLSTVSTAKQVLKQALEMAIGRAPKPGEVDGFVKALNAKERAHPSVSKSTSTSTTKGGNTTSTSTSTSKSKPINPSAVAESWVDKQKGTIEKEKERYQGAQYMDSIHQMLGIQ
jgi:hypothetical protein